MLDELDTDLDGHAGYLRMDKTAIIHDGNLSFIQLAPDQNYIQLESLRLWSGIRIYYVLILKDDFIWTVPLNWKEVYKDISYSY